MAEREMKAQAGLLKKGRPAKVETDLVTLEKGEVIKPAKKAKVKQLLCVKMVA